MLFGESTHQSAEESVAQTRHRTRRQRSVTLKEETILDQWSMMVDGAARYADEVLEEIERRLEVASIPGDCGWDPTEVKSSGWLSRVRREFLIVRVGQFNDYRIYVGVREYGIHLDVCRFLTVEPGFLKKAISAHTFGLSEFLSAPKNILSEQDLRAWVTVVHHAVVDSVESLMKRLKQDPGKLRRESKGALAIW